MATGVMIFYETERGPAVIARVDNPDVVRQAAAVAVQEAEERAKEISGEDAVLFRLATAEVSRLADVLSMLGLVGPRCAAGVM